MTPPVYTYSAGENGLHVNSYLVELESGIVAVDAGLLNSDARALRARSRRSASRCSPCWSRTRTPITSTGSRRSCATTTCPSMPPLTSPA